MKVTTVNYQRLYPTGVYQNEKIGVEIQLDDSTPEQGLELAKKIVDDFHRSSNPSLYPKGNEPIVSSFVPEVQVNKENLTNEQKRSLIIEGHVKTINECKTLKNLEMFSAMVQRENIDVLYEAYHNKKKELQ